MPKKKTIMRAFKINEISAVDTPAQEGARMMLMKRNSTKVVDVPLSGEDNDEDEGVFAYTPDSKDPSKNKLKIADKECKTDKALVSKALTELEAMFRGNEIPSEHRNDVISTLSKAWLETNPEKTEADLPSILKSNTQESDMNLEEMKKNHDAAIAKKDAELAKAKALGEMNDAQKAHYATLNDADKETFVAKTADERAAIVKALGDADAVVYKSADGIEYRKSAGEAMIALAKKADESMKLAKAEKEAREHSELKKRATDTFKNLPGTEDEKAALLKSIEGITDEAVRKKALESVKAGDNAIAAAFTRKGANSLNGGTEEGASAADQLDTMAKKMATDEKIDYHKAYSKVLSTPEGSALYNQTIKN